ncbi:PAS domain-containing sensor histidine kinase [Massilia sp. PAMC28688]|uniref:PAS domain-containing sensor histidine kinase n=1 Tax=Massilia sp. PAMC28688 TaxID=2861283 RepID=UPI001C634234|nr:PAS domain-containing sensor histidine kinase [Massilia sp. PAMC28688]QYF95317.1 PAS domain-containing sensor histidine kinase [Massilia sp. PAMC28688]
MSRSTRVNSQPRPGRAGSDLAEQFRAIAEMHGDIAWVLDCYTGKVLYLSQSAIPMAGFDVHDIESQLLDPDAAGPLAPLCAGLQERLRRFSGGDLSRKRLVRCHELRTAGGRTIPVEVTSTIMTDASGAPDTLVGTVRDMSEVHARMDHQRRFTSMLNHEFRTPLSTIDGAIQRLEVTGADADDATRQRYRKIQVAVDRLIAMMDEYLSPERMAEVGAARPADSVSPALLLEEAADQVRASGRAVDLEIGTLPPRIRCQPNGLRVAVKVLVDNALQYSPGDSPISLGARQADGGITLTVRDRGNGVPPADLARIFDKRYRGSNAAGFGSGLGLYMARSVIDVYGGTVSVQNVAPRGAEFRIWLPTGSGTGKCVAPKVINSDNSRE